MLQRPFLRGGEGRDRPRSAGGSDGLQARRPATGAGKASQVAVDGMEVVDTAVRPAGTVPVLGGAHGVMGLTVCGSI
uniref:Uncharacterized protein n=1 Tax=Oryza punctata TaxID=4537 RepID=A0A0E0K119_ORYPU